MPRNLLRLGLVLFLFALPTACDGQLRLGPDEEPDERPSAGPPPLPPCSANDDCRGGELCVGASDDEAGVCREVCADDTDCDDVFYATCDRDAGFCVQCVRNDDCGAAEACVDSLCVFFCRQDDDCGSSSFCDERSGECLDRACSGDGDCAGGFACEDFRCVSILPIVCTADAVRCVDDAIETCNGDGTAADRAPCAEGEGCVDDGDGPRCAALVCVPDEIGCTDDGDAFVCDATGTQRTLLPCRSDQYCAGGVCRQQLCPPATATCAADARVVCDERGATTTVEPCAAEERCADSAFGCSCRASADDATCVTRVCAPGAGQCVGNGVRVCADDGSGFSAVTDCGNDTCVEGRCLPPQCTPGATFCSGDALLTCEADGAGYRSAACPATCDGVDGDAACVARLCEPDSVRCAADGDAVLVCNARGTAETSSACGDGFCVDGACQARVCEPLSTRCASATSVFVCDALGGSERTVACDVGASCVEGGVCRASGGAEDTNAACSDGVSNDGDQYVDCDDFDCSRNDAVTVCRGVSIQLTWDTDDDDLDLHLSRAVPAAFCGDDDCHYGQRAPAWGPRLDIDDQNGFGPELITFPAPADGRYTVLVDPYNVRSASGETSATLEIRRGGELLRERSRTLRQGEQWIPVVVVVSSGAISVELVDSVADRSESCVSQAPTPPPEGASCTRSADCPLENFCDPNRGRCVAGCEVDGDCGDGRSCNSNGSCTEASSGGGFGASCANDADCGAPLTCGNSARCVEPCVGNDLFDCVICTAVTGQVCQCLSVPGVEPFCS